MCYQDICQHACGCLKQERFHQCQQLVGTPYRCMIVTRVYVVNAPFVCATHLTPISPAELAAMNAARTRGGSGEEETTVAGEERREGPRR
ncbi:hypothetical protein Vi05172_g7216 [Venturia inaequalis]|nr:hypothetical protein Vi05172_g7216 [Venturia inaequalis]